MTNAVGTRERETLGARWGGGRSPWDVGWPKLMMWLFLISDAMTFAAMTVILICSSTTMAMAVYAIRRGERRQTVWFLAATIFAGLVFAGMQAKEWSHFIAEGARLTGNPWGVPAFSFSFFVITGLHGAHVLAGIVYLWAIADRVARGRSSADGVEVAGLYWGFVDLVWVFIWSSIYLL